MKIEIEGQQYDIPLSLNHITLQQRIDWDKKYGKDLRDRLKKIKEIKDGFLKELEFAEYQVDLACKTLAFFANIPIPTIKNTDIYHVLTIYRQLMHKFTDDEDFAEKEYEAVADIYWENNYWYIGPPQIDNKSKHTFGEFLNAKQITKNLYEVANQKYEALLNLCCIYLRKKDEEFTELLMDEKGERMELFRKLPMPYALQVGFFFQHSTTSYTKVFLSSMAGAETPQPSN